MKRKLIAASLALLVAAAANGTGIEVNQVGFLPSSQKLAVVPAGAASAFSVVDAATGKLVLQGTAGPAARWDAADESVRIADFSGLDKPGSYRIRIDGLPDSAPFTIGADAYRALDAAAIKSYYFQRSGTALLPQHAGPYARPLGHPDTRVLVHASAASRARPAGTAISSPKGWYDAGDYNKYVVNSGITTYTLLHAYEQFPEWFDALHLNLPESGNGLPDILNEVLWNLDWMASMQDPDDGGVYHKLTNKAFDRFVMPEHATAPRYVVQKTTAATLDFAAVMATASRVLSRFEQQQPGRRARYLASAEAAWRWARANPNVVYQQPADISTGTYGDKALGDEFSWAATELLIATGKEEYRAASAQPFAMKGSEPAWSDVGPLGWMSLATVRLPASVDAGPAKAHIVALADKLLAQQNASPYRISMTRAGFAWGSNGALMNQAMVLVHAYQITHRRDYLNAAQSGLDYVLGRNPLGMSFVTGIGAKSPMHPHHRLSASDGVEAPVPGLLVGGANPGQQDSQSCAGVSYPSSLPALSYLDNVCSYASNEVAINWNAPLVYVAAALEALQP